MIKTAVIGYGFSAKYFHIPFILHLEEFHLSAVSTSQAAQVKQDLDGIVCYNSADELIQKTDAQLIVITAPNYAHFSLAKACLLNNKHVILEKPMVSTVVEAEILIALAKEKNLMLSVYHNRRWDGDFLTVKELLDKKLLGDVRLFESHFDRFRPLVRDKWKEKPGLATGVWFDLGAHLLDQVVCLFGKPMGLTAHCLSLRLSSEVTDYFHVLLHYSDLEVSLQSSPFCAHQKLRYRIEGTKGSYHKYHFDPQEADLLANTALDDKHWGKEPEENYGTICTGEEIKLIPTQKGDYSIFYKGIAKALYVDKSHVDKPYVDKPHVEKPPPVSAEDALFIISLLHLAVKSSEQGKTIWL